MNGMELLIDAWCENAVGTSLATGGGAREGTDPELCIQASGSLGVGALERLAGLAGIPLRRRIINSHTCNSRNIVVYVGKGVEPFTLQRRWLGFFACMK